MANNLYILGNGFDLDMGWKTSYSSFYEAFKKRFYEISGSVYTRNMIVKEQWYCLENYLRSCIEILKEEDIEHFWNFWFACESFIAEYLYDNNGTNGVYRNTNKSSYAYRLANEISDDDIVYSFNYTNPFEKIGTAVPKRFYRIHGAIEDLINKNKPELGVDSGALKNMGPKVALNDKVSVFVKSTRHNFLPQIQQNLRQADKIVFFGHSLCITDSDYFKPFFQEILNGTVQDKSIIFITKDAKGLLAIKQNMKEWDIEYDDLLKTPNRFSCIYTYA